VKRLAKIFTFLMRICCFLTLVLSSNCLALEQQYPTIRGETLSISAPLPNLINYFFNFALMASGVVALTIITIAGFRWMSAAVSPEQKRAAMEQIKAGIFGLLIVLASFLILSTINPQLVQIEAPELPR